MPVLLAWVDEDNISGTNLAYLATTTGDDPDPVCDVQSLPIRVKMPSGSRPWRESHVGTTDRRLVIGAAYAVDDHVSRKPLCWSWNALAAALRVLQFCRLYFLALGDIRQSDLVSGGGRGVRR